MSTQNITNYTRDLEENIIDTSPAVDGQIKFAIDTGKLFLSNGGYWHIYKSPGMVGEYTLPGTGITVGAPVLAHLDADDATTLQDVNYQPINSGDAVSNWRCVTDGGSNHVTNSWILNAPTYVANVLNSKPAIRFRGAQFLSNESKKNVPLTDGSFTSFTVIKLDYKGDPVTGNKESDWRDYHAIWGGIGFGGSATICAQPALQVRWDVPQGTFSSVGGAMPACAVAFQNSTTFGPASTPTVINTQTDTLIIMQRWNGTNDIYGSKYQEITISGRYTKHINPEVGCPVEFSGLAIGHNNMRANLTETGEFDMGEFILLNGDLNNVEVNEIANHLSTKWGATWENL
jgi:hypothetical protein